ncbi:MAG: hypothetical protein WDN28_32820, partial [Chthoniobacter sp.]
FRVTPAHLPATCNPTTRPLRRRRLNSRVKGLRVLLVEDHADTAATLERLLLNSGYVVQDGHGCRRRAAPHRGIGIRPARQRYRLAGWERAGAHAQIHRSRANRPIAGVALSGFGMPEDLERSYAAGFQEHLIKPVDFALLRKALTRVSVKIPAPVPALA